MFAYCENNPVSGYDPSGNWDKKDHRLITAKNGFRGEEFHLVRAWAMKADEYPCESTCDYSTPFHGRKNGLSIGKELYNLALRIKNQKSVIKFSKNRVCFQYKNRGNKDETDKAQNELLKLVNSKDWRKQYKILLGLALHTIQDYFAHVIPVYIRHTYPYYNPYLPSIECFKETNYEKIMMFETEEKMGLPNCVIEDNVNIFSWRYRYVKILTNTIYYKFWVKGKKINQLEVKKLNKSQLY